MLGLPLYSLSLSAQLAKLDVKAAALGAAAALTLTTTPALAGDKEAGEAVFSANCVACHRGGQNVILPSKTLEKQALEEYLDGGFSEEAVRKQVRNGKNAMPAFGGRLPDDDIENVATCARALSNHLSSRVVPRGTRPQCLCVSLPPARSCHCHLRRGFMGGGIVETDGQ